MFRLQSRRLLSCRVCASHRRALSQEAGLLHAAGSAKLLHVLAEVTLAALRPHAGLAAPAPRPPAPRPTAGPPAQRLTARHHRTSQLEPERARGQRYEHVGQQQTIPVEVKTFTACR